MPVENGGKPVRLLAKYNYKCNPSKPGGFDELTITQGEKLELSRAHPSNPHWWEAKNENGEVGFVPASYMMVSEYCKNLCISRTFLLKFWVHNVGTACLRDNRREACKRYLRYIACIAAERYTALDLAKFIMNMQLTSFPQHFLKVFIIFFFQNRA